MLEDVLEECELFLEANPSEAIIVSVKCDHGDTSENTFDTFFDSYLNNALWYKENRIPQLSEVRGRLVFFNRFSINSENNYYTDLNTGLNFSGWKDQGKYKAVEKDPAN